MRQRTGESTEDFKARERAYTRQRADAGLGYQRATPRTRACLNCASAFTTDTTAKYCSDKCRYAYRDANRDRALDNARSKAYYEANREVRQAKNRAYHYKHGGKPRHILMDRCTTTDCDEAPIAKDMCMRHYRASRRAEGTPWATGSDPKARAKRHGVEYEPINRMAVFERDGWTCSICRHPIDRSATFPHQSSASLDHIHPISAGGPHTYENVQLACWGCNLRKRDSTKG